MDTSARLDRNQASAFSLVEVTIAIAIAAFSFVAIFGLLPVGLNTFHQSMDASIGTQIVQRVITEAQQTDFDVLVGARSEPFLITARPRYFNEQGEEQDSPELSVYQVNVKVTPITTTPGSANVHLATLTVQIANKPGQLDIPIDSNTLLWRSPGGMISTYSALIARNQ